MFCIGIVLSDLSLLRFRHTNFYKSSSEHIFKKFEMFLYLLFTYSSEENQLKDILAVVGFSKATYMYWQKRFDIVNPNKDLEEKTLNIHNENKDFGYRRICGVLSKESCIVYKKASSKNYEKAANKVFIRGRLENQSP